MNNVLSFTDNYELTVYHDPYMGNVWQEYPEHQSKIIFVNQGNKFDWGEKIDLDGYEVEEWVKDMEEKCVVFLPLYIFDHSGIKFELFKSCPWDSSHVGFIYIEKGAIKGESLQHLETEDEALKIINMELDELNLYYSEGWYGFWLKNTVTDQEVDAVCGFLGLEGIEKGLKEHLNPEYHYLIKEALESILYDY